MGSNSTVVIINDGLDEINKDANFGSKLRDAISRVNSYEDPSDILSISGHYAKVIETHHADQFSVIAVGNNNGVNLGTFFAYENENDFEVKILKQLANKYGYQLRRKSNRRNND